MAAAESAEMKGSGRLKLQGVLDELVQQSKEAEEKQPMNMVQDSAMEEAAKSLVELPNSIKVEDLTGLKKRGLVSPRKRRRRRKKELISASDESDGDTVAGVGRRVDLARFSETTPLYVMCREWMRNKPQRKASQSSSAEHQATDDPQDGDLLLFPSPQPPSGEGQSSSTTAAHSPQRPAQNLDQELAKQMVSGRTEVEGLKQQHMARWRTVKSSWLSTSHAEQERYKDSLRILKEMFQR